MKDRRGRSIHSVKVVSPQLEILEARRLLSTIESATGFRRHLPEMGGSARQSGGVDSQGEDGSPSTALRVLLATADSTTALQEGSCLTEVSDNAPAASSTMPGSGPVANPSTSSMPARTASPTDSSVQDESSSISQNLGNAALSVFGQGSTDDDDNIFISIVTVDRAGETTENALATELGASVPVGPALAMGARSPVANYGTTRVTVVTSPEALPIPGRHANASDSSLSHRERISGTQPDLASTHRGSPRGEDLPSSIGADLIAGFSLFDQAAVGQAFDQLLDRLDDLESGLLRLGTTANLGLKLMATAIAIMELVHRYLGKREGERDRDGAHDEDPNGDRMVYFPGLPGLPYHWSLEER
jgi:hypothetical protein